MKPTSELFNWRRALNASDLASTTRLVLRVIQDYANSMDDVCWPRLERIAEDAGLSVRCVSDHIAVAEERGWLTRWRTRRNNRRWAHCNYRLSVPEDVARRQIATLTYDLVDETDASFTDPLPEPRSDEMPPEMSSFSDAESYSHARRSDAEGYPQEPRSDAALNSGPAEPENTGVSGHYWNDVPTNTPVNRNTNKPSLSHTTSVNEGMASEKEIEIESRALANWMFERLRRLNPSHRAPDIAKWSADIERMCADGRTPQQIAVLFRYANDDKFWSGVIVGPAKLREHWDQLVLRRNASRATATPTETPSRSDDRSCAHVEHGCRCAHVATTIIGAGSSRRGYCGKHIGQYED